MKTNEESFDDIVFENRNKAYGAYELRKKYSKRGAIALAISLFILFSAVGGPLIASIMRNDIYRKYVEKNSETVLSTLDNEKPEVAPPPPPPPPAPTRDIKFVAPTVVEEITNEEIELASTDDLAECANNQTVDTASHELVIAEKKEEIIPEEPVELFAVQEKPAFPGGDAALLKFVAEHTKYPIVALETGIEGTVHVRFVVTKSGQIGQTLVLRGADPLLDEEALRVVKSIPAWSPGKNNGNPVNVWFIIPVKFVLQ